MALRIPPWTTPLGRYRNTRRCSPRSTHTPRITRLARKTGARRGPLSCRFKFDFPPGKVLIGQDDQAGPGRCHFHFDASRLVGDNSALRHFVGRRVSCRLIETRCVKLVRRGFYNGHLAQIARFALAGGRLVPFAATGFASCRYPAGAALRRQAQTRPRGIASGMVQSEALLVTSPVLPGPLPCPVFRLVGRIFQSFARGEERVTDGRGLQIGSKGDRPAATVLDVPEEGPGSPGATSCRRPRTQRTGPTGCVSEPLFARSQISTSSSRFAEPLWLHSSGSQPGFR